MTAASESRRGFVEMVLLVDAAMSPALGSRLGAVWLV